MIAKLPANVELDDLIQVGMIGLSDARSRFGAAQGVPFETFATQRIGGAKQKLGRAPSSQSIARLRTRLREW